MANICVKIGGERVILNDEIVAYSSVINQKILEIYTNDFNYTSNYIELPNVRSDTLKIIVDWAKRHGDTLEMKEENGGVEIEGCWDWEANLLDVSKDQLFDIIWTAKDLIIPQLYEAGVVNYTRKFGEEPTIGENGHDSSLE